MTPGPAKEDSLGTEGIPGADGAETSPRDMSPREGAPPREEISPREGGATRSPSLGAGGRPLTEIDPKSSRVGIPRSGAPSSGTPSAGTPSSGTPISGRAASATSGRANVSTPETQRVFKNSSPFLTEPTFLLKLFRPIFNIQSSLITLDIAESELNKYNLSSCTTERLKSTYKDLYSKDPSLPGFNVLNN
jgi:hypothetical protein